MKSLQVEKKMSLCMIGYFIGAIMIVSLGWEIPTQVENIFSQIITILIGYVTYTIGASFSMEFPISICKERVFFTFIRIIGCNVAIAVTFVLIGFKIEEALILGAITTVVGRKKDDEVIAILFFQCMLTLARLFTNATKHLSLPIILLQPIIEIVLAVIIGIGLGILYKNIRNKCTSYSILYKKSIYFVILLAIIIGNYFKLSPIILCLVLGVSIKEELVMNKLLCTIYFVSGWIGGIYFKQEIIVRAIIGSMIYSGCYLLYKKVVSKEQNFYAQDIIVYLFILFAAFSVEGIQKGIISIVIMGVLLQQLMILFCRNRQ